MVRGKQAVDPAGGAAAARDRRPDLREHLEAVFETAVGLRLHDAEQIRRPQARDQIVADAARGFGLSRPLAGKPGNVARPQQKLGNLGSVQGRHPRTL